jgi:hypothetical protein
MTRPNRLQSTRSVWCRSLYSGWMLATGVVLAAALIVIAILNEQFRTLCLLLLIAAAAVLATGAIKVTVSQEGVVVASTLFPFLRRRIRLHRIDQAFARWTRPLEIGGWGYRWKPGMRAVSLRGGDALWLDLTNGTQFIVTIDDAQTAATLLNTHLGSVSGSGSDKH